MEQADESRDSLNHVVNQVFFELLLGLEKNLEHLSTIRLYYNTVKTPNSKIQIKNRGETSPLKKTRREQVACKKSTKR